MRPVVGTKAPKMRFKIGQKIRYEGVVYLIDGAFRMKDNPHEWYYRLVDWTPFAQNAALYDLEEMLNVVAPEIERVVYQPFERTSDVHKHFWDIPPPPGRRGDICHPTNKQLLQKGEIVT